MPTDPVAALASEADFNQTAFADLAEHLQAGELVSILGQATRAIEAETKRRLAPFTKTETHRAEGVDPDEYGTGASSVPIDLPGATGMSYARALGSTDQVRHIWLSEYAPQFEDMWGPYEVAALTIYRSVGGTGSVNLAALAPEPDTGHLWLPLGTFCPVGSRIRVTYTGGYGTVPADLVAACVTWTASMILNRLDPERASSAHDPGTLRNEAIEHLAGYYRD